jgi:glycosyltransferase involved in cell wall biosynthesis
MPEFSLIVATKGRTAELARLIASIDSQNESDYELIIVDQNDDDRLIPILERSANQDRIVHLKSSPGVSHARNVGMEQARGKIIAFPDDDCWYPPDILRMVSDWFETNRSYDILTVNSLDADGRRSANRWFQNSCDLRPLNIYRTSVGYSIFIRADGIARIVRYDEEIGPGANTPYLGGEDSDFVLTAMEKGARGRFEAKWHIGHPLKDIRNASVSRDRAYIYGLGMGFVQRKHRLTWLWAGLAAFDFSRAMCAFVVGRREPAALWYRHGCGLVDGFFALGSNHSAYHSE